MILPIIPLTTRVAITAAGLVVYAIGSIWTQVRYGGDWWLMWLPFLAFILFSMLPWIHRGQMEIVKP